MKRNGVVEKVIWLGVAAGATALAAYVARRGIEAGWQAFAKKDPPRNVASWDTSWGEAIAWTAATALTAGFARLLAERGAMIGFERLTGHEPPV